jgi:hypothetical protein
LAPSVDGRKCPLGHAQQTVHADSGYTRGSHTYSGTLNTVWPWHRRSLVYPSDPPCFDGGTRQHEMGFLRHQVAFQTVAKVDLARFDPTHEWH